MGFSPDRHPPRLCDRQPIQVPGAIQPHGALLAVDGLGVVTQLAGDTHRAVGMPPEALLGQRADRLVDSQGRGLFDAVAEHGAPLAGYLARWRPEPPGEGQWDVTAHPNKNGTLVEFEPSTPARVGAAEGMAQLTRAVASLDLAQGLDELFATMAAEVRRLSGFDRVLVCRLLDEEVGTVVAEARSGALPSLLHRRFPGSDRPRQARKRHPRHRFRVIPDTQYVPAPLRAAGPDVPEPIDASDCTLRSVSPVHLHCLRNMGVAASMAIPVVVDNVLWGLIACHHSEPRLVAYELREACRHLGRVFSHQIEAREEARHHRQAADLRRLRTTWLDDLRRALEAGDPVRLDLAELARMVPCDGVALAAPGRVELSGHTPDEAETAALAGWLAGSLRHDVFASHHLAGQLPAAASYATHASGVLATAIGAPDPVVLLWFRGEEITRVVGTGDPHWERTVRQTARRWTRAEVGAARQLGRSLTPLLQQQALRELNHRLRDALAEQQSLVAQKNVLMQEVHHRVQNSLQIVNSMLQLQARQTTDSEVRGQFEGAVNRLMAVSAVHRHLWRSSDAQNVRLGPYLRELCADLMLSWGDGWAGHLVVRATDVAIPSQTAVTLALLVTELLTNAAKYAYAGAPGPVEVRADGAAGGELRLTVRDRGCGMQGEVRGGGLGSKLIRIFTAQLGGRIETLTGAGGTTVTIRVPLEPRAARRGKAAGPSR